MIEGDLANFAAGGRRRVAEAAAALEIGTRRQRAAQRRRICGEQLRLLRSVNQSMQLVLIQPLHIARRVRPPLGSRPAITARSCAHAEAGFGADGEEGEGRHLASFEIRVARVVEGHLVALPVVALTQL